MQAVDNDLISFVSKFNIDEILSMNIYIPHHSVTFLLYHFFYSVKRSASEISFGNHLRYVSQVNKRLQELLVWRIWKKRSNHINILTSDGFSITVRINKLPDNDYWLIVYFCYFFCSWLLLMQRIEQLLLMSMKSYCMNMRDHFFEFYSL